MATNENANIGRTIERSILIAAPIDAVWRLVSTPGWWVNDGEIITHDTTVDGDLTIVHWKGHELPIRTVSTKPPNAIRYTWGSGEVDAPVESTIDFTLEEEDGGTRVVVVETGFDTFADPEQAARVHRENSSGWEQELRAASDLLGA